LQIVPASPPGALPAVLERYSADFVYPLLQIPVLMTVTVAFLSVLCHLPPVLLPVQWMPPSPS